MGAYALDALRGGRARAAWRTYCLSRFVVVVVVEEEEEVVVVVVQKATFALREQSGQREHS